MFKLHVVQAEYGDCLLLQFGTASRARFVLIDGGPATTYERHLRPAMRQVVGEGSIELAVLSHVDTDHVVGLLDYIAELRAEGEGGSLPPLQGLWHNSFQHTVDPGGEIQARLQSFMSLEAAAALMTNSGMTVNGIAEGNSLRLAARALQVPINADFPDGLIALDTSPAPRVFGNLRLQIVGPTRANLAKLQSQWIRWLEEHESAVNSGDPFVMANADKSIPNLSSIMFLATADGKTILFTGDGRSDHLLDGLGQAGLLGPEGHLHVDVLKLPHHGSERNITKRFFRAVTADTYVVSANGRDDNPDLATLIWLVEAARDRGRPVKLVVTNATPSLAKLAEEYPTSEYPYVIEALGAEAHHMTLTLSRTSARHLSAHSSSASDRRT